MANVQYYDVIIKPVVTEKSMEAMADKSYTFLVHPEHMYSLQLTALTSSFLKDCKE